MEAAQGTNDWLTWRKGGIGSSEAPIIMDASPWRTRLDLWEERTNRKPPQDTSWAMQRGIDLEPAARAYYELLSDVEMPPKLFVHPDFDFLRASLDGFNADAKRVLEIKCPGEDDHRIALEGKIPEKYQWQLIHQLMVTGAQVAHYLSFRNDRGVVVEFKRDEQREEMLFKAECEFWRLVQNDIQPELTDRDFLNVKQAKAPELWEATERWAELKVVETRIGTELEGLRAKMLEEAAKLKAPRMRCAGVQLMQVTRKGAVNYAAIPELKGVDLERFRKKPTSYFDVRLMK